MPRGKHEAPQKKTKAVYACLSIFAVIIVIVAGVLIWWYGDQTAPEIADNAPSPEVSADVQVQESESPEEAVNVAAAADREAGRYYTILVVGYDQVEANTDTIMAARYDTVEKKLNVVSIPRDTLVNVSWPNKKINSIYLAAGKSIEGLKDGIKDIIGFEIDSYIFVDISAFKEIVDCIGGVNFDVPCNMHYSDPEQNLTINIEKGYQLLNGEDALKVCRYREYPMGDIDRISVQQDFLKAAIKQMLSLGNALKAPEIINIIFENLDTDLSVRNMKWYVTQLLSLKSEDISFMTMPANYCCSINGGSYVSIYVDDWMDMVNTYLNPLRSEIKSEDCNILYQINAEPGKYVLTPSNYAVTNGGELAGGVNSFQKHTT